MTRKAIALLLLVSLYAALAHAQQPTITIRMGTLAPAGSLWHDALMQLRDKWRKISNGRVNVIIFAGGVQGDEPEMVRKMRNRQLQSVALSGAGMAGIEPGVACLQIPMMLQSYEELDYVRDRMAPKLEKMIEARNFVVLNWGDAGWVHFFCDAQAKRLDDIRKLKLFTWAGDNDILDLWRANGFHAVPLPATDIIMGLKTGLIDVVPTVPLYALSSQFFPLAKYMINVKWAPLVGATVIRKDVWETIPADIRDEMMKAGRETGDIMRASIRKMGDDAVSVMQKKGLVLVSADPATVEDWRQQAEKVYPNLRGKTVPADLFDEARRLRDEYRARPAGASKSAAKKGRP